MSTRFALLARILLLAGLLPAPSTAQSAGWPSWMGGPESPVQAAIIDADLAQAAWQGFLERLTHSDGPLQAFQLMAAQREEVRDQVAAELHRFAPQDWRIEEDLVGEVPSSVVGSLYRDATRLDPQWLAEDRTRRIATDVLDRILLWRRSVRVCRASNARLAGRYAQAGLAGHAERAHAVETARLRGQESVEAVRQSADEAGADLLGM